MGAGRLLIGAAMNGISDFLTIDAVDAGLASANKKTLFQQLAVASAKLTGCPAKQIAACLSERERLSSTGFGGGIAIPHGKLDGLGHITGYFARA